MKSMNINYMIGQVVAPSDAVFIHDIIMSAIGTMVDQGTKPLSEIIILNQQDIDRLFPVKPVEQFYITIDDELFWVIKRKDEAIGDEVFYDLVMITDPTFIGPVINPFMMVDIPNLRIKTFLNDAELSDKFKITTGGIVEQEYREVTVDQYWNPDTLTWNAHESKQSPLVDKKRINLKDIPLNTRDGRRLVRNSMEQHRELLTNSFIKSGAQISFDEWMTVSQGVHMQALKDLEKIDALPDHEYVEAMVTFKKAEVQAYHSHAVNEGKTELHLFDWCLKEFGAQFHDIGRKEAMAEVHLDYTPEEIPQLDEDHEEDFVPAIFMVTFDSTIVENHYPIIGPVSPYSIETLKVLIEKGHHVIVLTDRQGDDLTPLVDFFEQMKVIPIGYTHQFPASGLVHRDDIYHRHEKYHEDMFDVTYMIDHRYFSAPSIQISGRDYEPTFYWANVITDLNDKGYLEQEDIERITNSLTAEE